MTHKQPARGRELHTQTQPATARILRPSSKIDGKQPGFRPFRQLDQKGQDAFGIVQQGEADWAGCRGALGQEASEDIGDIHDLLSLRCAMHIQDADVVVIDIAQRAAIIQERGSIADHRG